MDPNQPQQEFVPEAKKQELLNTIQNIRIDLDRYKAAQKGAERKSDIVREKMLHEAFNKLEMAGVDLNDQSSVAAFIDKLRSQNPEQADLFEEAMDALLNDRQDEGVS